ncbi:MAG: NUDIX hydrolase [Micropruina sp.]|uniref:NUDIX hydrolase n=1 Tax=Micropruina sp. TaxID=2737536 RepID=UPI0039E2F41C
MSTAPDEFEVQLQAADGVGVLEWSGRASQETVDRAVSLAADDGLIVRGLRRIEVSLPASDVVGRRALQRAGFRLEGTRREALALPDGSFGDVVMYARLASDLVYGPGGFTGVMNSVLPRKRLIAHALITDPWDRVCLMETTFKPDWELPGGIVNPRESPWAGAVREIAEEMSLDVGVGRVLVVDWLAPYLGWEDAVELIFDGGVLTQEQIEAIVPDPGEIRAVHWLTPEKAADKMAPFARGRMLAAVSCRLGGGTQYLERGLPRRD